MFQSLQGHPLLTIVTKEIINQEVQDEVRAHFIDAINEQNCPALNAAWNAIIALESSTEHQDTLGKLNFSEQQVTDIIHKLEEKYGSQLNPILKHHLRDGLEVRDPFPNLAAKFGTIFKDILQKKTAELETKTLNLEQLRAARVSYFEAKDANNSNKPSGGGATPRR